MVKTITKRDGRKVIFDIDKITNAIYKAAQSIGGNNPSIARELSEKVVDLINSEDYPSPSVEHIQDLVEKVLIENGHSRTAKEYILYRAERTRQREMNTKLMKTYEERQRYKT